MPARRAAPSANPPPRPARSPAKGPTRGALLAALAERERELAEEREHQAATAEVLKVIASSPSDVEPVFQAIAESAKRLLGGYSGAVMLYAGDWTHMAAFTSIGPEADAAAKAMWPQRHTQSNSPVFEAIRRHGVAEIADTERELEGINRDRARARGYRSFLSVALTVDGELFGSIVVTRKEPGEFAPRHIQLLQTFADQAAIAIQNARLFDAVQAKTRDLAEALRFQTATSEVLKVISQSPNSLQPVLDVIVETSRQLCATETSTVWMLLDGKYRLTAATMSAERLSYHEYLRAHPLTPDQRGSSTARAAREKRTVHIPDILQDPEFGEGPMGSGERRALLSVPLMRDGTAVGVITLLRSHEQPFTARQIEAVETFADQAVIAIHNAQLFRETQEALERQTATSEILKVISQSPTDARPVFDRIVLTAARVLALRHGPGDPS